MTSKFQTKMIQIKNITAKQNYFYLHNKNKEK